jgi:hypothetical protein
MKYNRTFARSQWRASFDNDSKAFRHSRKPGQTGSFRKFTGRTKAQ